MDEEKFVTLEGLKKYNETIDSEMAGKQEELVSGTNIKTINNSSILGSGNLNIPTAGIIDISSYSLPLIPDNKSGTTMSISTAKKMYDSCYETYKATGKLPLFSTTKFGSSYGYFNLTLIYPAFSTSKLDNIQPNSSVTYDFFGDLSQSLYSSSMASLVGKIHIYFTVNYDENGNYKSISDSPQFWKEALQILPIGNKFAYTPTTDYNPATKKYVDDSIPTVPTNVSELVNDANYLVYKGSWKSLSSSPNISGGSFILADHELGIYSIVAKTNENSLEYLYLKGDSSDTHPVDAGNGIATLYYVKDFSTANVNDIVAYSVFIKYNSHKARQIHYTYTKKNSHELGVSWTDAYPSVDVFLDNSSAQSISGKKTFTVLPESSVVPTSDDQLVNKKYVDDNAGGGGISINDVYKALAEEYDSTKTYNKGQYTYYNGNIYLSNASIYPAEEWNANHWDLISPVDAMNMLNYISKGQSQGDIQFYSSTASGGNSFAAGNGNTASGNASVAFGSSSTASGSSSLAVGMGTEASGSGAVALNNSKSKGMFSTALNMGNVLTSGMGCVAEGTGTVGTDTQGASPTQFCHAEGSSTVYGFYSHAEGNNNTSYGNGMHVEGYNNTIGDASSSGTGSHAEGYNNVINGSPAAAHVEGQGCVVGTYGNMAHAEGYHTIANSVAQHAEGQYNIEMSTGLPILHVVGNGYGDSSRSNAHTLDMNGNAWFAGDVYVGSTSGTNKDSGSKKLITGLVTLTYGSSTWADFEEAYNENKIVYCKVNGSRMAFMAYVGANNVEFQYYRSMSQHSIDNQTDELYVYKLTKPSGSGTGTWETTTRKAGCVINTGNGLSKAYTTDEVTLSLDSNYVDNLITTKLYTLSGLSAYSSSSTYSVGDYVYNENDMLIYKCNTAISTAESWTAAHWTVKTYLEYVTDQSSSSIANTLSNI